jgi:phosphoribosylformimino-5-aminoimidazole carboxamide ribotide isomerase
MQLIPAIDLQGGQFVRLRQGDFLRATDFGDPVAAARRLVDAGATRVHVVDLDAARMGRSEHGPAIAEIVAEIAPVPVQLGGGIRDAKAVDAALAVGVAQVVVGTLVVEEPERAAELARAHPGRLLAGLDHRPGPSASREVAVRGWVSGGGVRLIDALARLADDGFAGAVVTDIDRDGELSGPDLAGLAHCLAATELPVIASGGVATLADLTTLAGLSVKGRHLAGVIVGRAIAEGRLSVPEALATLGQPVQPR